MKKATLLDSHGRIIRHDDGLEYSLSSAGTPVTSDAPFAARHPILAAAARPVTAGIVTLATLASAPSFAQEYNALASAPEVQYVMAAVKAQGNAGSLWGDQLLFVNPSKTERSEGQLVLIPLGASAGTQDYSKPLSLAPGESLSLVDVIGEPTLGGTFTVRVETTAGEKPSVSELVTNTQQYGSDPSKKSVFFMYADAFNDSDLMLPGDVSLIKMPTGSAYYANLRLFGKQEPGDTDFPLVRVKGFNGPVEACQFDQELKIGGALQLVKLNDTFCPANNYSHFTIQQLRGMGLAEASIIYQNPDLAGANDGAIQRASMRRLVEEFRTQLSPEGQAEVNDELILSAYAKARPGAKVTQLVASYQPTQNWTHAANGDARELRLTGRVTQAAPATLVARAGITVIDEQGNPFYRNIEENATDVGPETRVEFPIADVRANMLANVVGISNVLAQYGFYKDTQASVWYNRDSQTWQSILPGQLQSKVTSMSWWDDNNTVVFNGWNGTGNFQVFVKGPESAMNDLYRLISNQEKQ